MFRMEAAVIVDQAGLLQNQGYGLFRRHRHVPVAISRRRGMDENILVDPFDGVTFAEASAGEITRFSIVI